MVSILQRPQGVVLGNCLTASIDEDYAGIATINTYSPHHLSEGSQVYITSIIGNYNGFWPVHIIDGYKFFLVKYDGTYAPYIQDASITYCPQESLHGWSCVELPIVFKARNDRYPTNEVDTARTILSYSNENGYLRIVASGSLGTFEDLAWVKISDAASDEVNGVIQILDKLSTSDVVLNLAYGTYDFTGAEIILHYQSYTIVVDIYAGLPATHRWYSQKPVALKATIDLIPDENNEVMFSISDILKSDITIVNNTLLGTLPSNLDAFTGFYIAYGESYDTSDGYTITTYESALTPDSLQGWAANSKLAFKNQYSGFLTNYLDKFLTLFGTPSATPGQYFDLSFIVNSLGFSTFIQLVKKLNGVTLVTETNNLGRTDQGIIRVPIEISSSYDQICATALLDGDEVLNLASFANNPGPNNNWTTGATPSIVAGQSDILYLPYTFIPGFTYTLRTVISVSGVSGSLKAAVYDNSFNEIDSASHTLSPGGTITRDFIFVATAAMTQIGYSGNPTVGAALISSTVMVDQMAITEQLCITVDNECSNQQIVLSWLNNIGGFDHWTFKGQKEYMREIGETGETSKNIFPDWGNSYGEFADTERRRQTFRDSRKQILVHSEHVTLAQLQAIEYIKSSVLVQIVNSRYDRRTVIVDADSFVSYKDNDKLYNISFTLTYTDDIPSQRV